MRPKKRLLRALRAAGWRVASYRSTESGERVYQFRILDGNCDILFHVEFGERGDDDLAISYLMVMPTYQRGKGFGGHYLDAFLAFAKEAGFRSIRATEVLSGTEEFWSRHGFVLDPEANPAIDFVYRPANG